MIEIAASARLCPGVGGALVAILIVLSAAATAQTAAGGSSNEGAAPSNTPASGMASGLVDPSNGGVAGTGLGKMPSGANTDPVGTGMSVKGPPGQGTSPGTETSK